MVVEQINSNELLKKIRKLAITKQLNFLIGSGASCPAIPLMGHIPVEDERERNELLTKMVQEVSKKIIGNSIDKGSPIDNTLFNYINFISKIIGILNLSNSRQTPRTANIFTTNYDLFIEKASDIVSQNYKFIFNDGASGYFDRKLDGTNYNRTVSYRGLNDNYTNEIPSLTLIKPHGSMNWEKVGDSIFIRNYVIEESPVVVKPTGYEEQETFYNNHFHEMLRIFQLELDKPQSVLFVIGFSFQDNHIAKMVSRAIQNPELMVFAFGFSDNDRGNYLKNLGLMSERSNFKIITPINLDDSYKNRNVKENAEEWYSFDLSNLTKILLDASLEDLKDGKS